MAVDDRLGLFFRYRYIEGKSMKKVCQYFTIGRSTGGRWKARLMEEIAARPDLMPPRSKSGRPTRCRWPRPAGTSRPARDPVAVERQQTRPCRGKEHL